MGQPNYINGFDVTVHEHVLCLPESWRKPRTVFVNSMSDLFHEFVPNSFIRRVFEIMNQTSRHRFQVLTKRSERLLAISRSLPWSENIWMGVSVEDDRYCYRVDHLRAVPAKVRFLSLEPLLGPVPSLNLAGIDWVIVGGESGPHSRPINGEWVLEIKEHCQKAGVPFFFKQWGGTNKKKTGRLLQGKIWSQMPIEMGQNY